MGWGPRRREHAPSLGSLWLEMEATGSHCQEVPQPPSADLGLLLLLATLCPVLLSVLSSEATQPEGACVVYQC